MSNLSPARSDVADELRELLLALHSTELDEAQLEAIAAQVQTARGLVTGPTRERWYENRPTDDAAAQQGRADDFHTFSLFRGTAQPLAVPMVADITTDESGRPVFAGTVRLNQMYEGPPGAVHGGYVAGLFDDLLGGTQRLAADFVGLTGKLSVRYRAKTPLDTDLSVVGWVEERSGRRLTCNAEIRADGVVTAEASALFVQYEL